MAVGLVFLGRKKYVITAGLGYVVLERKKNG